MLNVDLTPAPGNSSASHRQIAWLIRDFARFTDCRQWVELTRMLMPFVSLGNPTKPPGIVLSAEQFTERWRTWQDELGPTQHSLTIRHSAVFGAEASCFVDALISSSPDLETVTQWGGQFYFVGIRQEEVWRIGSLEIVPLWITEPPGATALWIQLERFLSAYPPDTHPDGSQESS